MPRRRKPTNPFEGLSPEIEEEIYRSYVRYREITLEEVVTAALKYEAEKDRHDNAHRARLSKVRDSLEARIKEAYNARKPITEVSEWDIGLAEGSLERKRLRKEEEQAEAAKGPSYENVASLIPKGDD